MTYHHLGPFAYPSGHYGDIPPPEKLRIPVDTYVNDLTGAESDE